MRIRKLVLNNFKQFSNLEVDFKDSNEIMLFGKNEVGKTTVADAACWLLFGKDLMDRTEANFGIKTRDENEEIIHGLNHEVIGVLELEDGITVELMRSYSEIWTQKRGSATKSMTGHETNYFINSVPKLKKEYDEYVNQYITDELTYKLCTNPHYFNDNLDVKTRREVITSLVNLLSDIEIAKNNNLNLLIPLLNEGKTIDDISTIVLGENKRLNELLKSLPIRKDEANKALYQVDHTIKGVEEKIDINNGKIELLKSQESNIADGDYSELEAQIRELDSKKRVLLSEKSIIVGDSEKLSSIDAEINEVNSKILNINVPSSFEINHMESYIADKKIELLNVSARFDEVNAKEFTSNVVDSCPTCGQSLPAELVAESVEIARKSFNSSKVSELKQLNEKGQKIKASIEESQKNLDSLKESIRSLKDKKDELLAEKDILTKKRMSLIQENQTLQQAHTDKINKSVELIDSKIDTLRSDIDSAALKLDSLVEPIRSEIAGLLTLNAELGTIKAQIIHNEVTRQRMAEIDAEIKTTAKKYESNQLIVLQVEEFKRVKVDAISQQVNDLFEIAKFRLFEEQVNGGVRDTCIAVGKKGVAWNEAMNTGQKVNIGLDIAKTLSKHYGVNLPIFVENAESVSKIQPLDNQVIYLYHNARENKLQLKLLDQD